MFLCCCMILDSHMKAPPIVMNWVVVLSSGVWWMSNPWLGVFGGQKEVFFPYCLAWKIVESLMNTSFRCIVWISTIDAGYMFFFLLCMEQYICSPMYICICMCILSARIANIYLVPLKGGRWHIIPQLAVYTTYIPLIYPHCFTFFEISSAWRHEQGHWCSFLPPSPFLRAAVCHYIIIFQRKYGYSMCALQKIQKFILTFLVRIS